jgi:hypothetical protein
VLLLLDMGPRLMPECRYLRRHRTMMRVLLMSEGATMAEV